MAYAYVRTQYIDISDSVYWGALGTRYFTYRFVCAEYYDPDANRTKLTLSAARLKLDVNTDASIYGKILFNGSVVGHFCGAGMTGSPGSFVDFGSGGSVTVDHNALGAAPDVSVSFARADGTPDTVGGNFGFSPRSGVLVGFSAGTTRSLSLTAHQRASAIASCPPAAETGSTLSLNVSRSSASFRHRASVCVGAETLYVSPAFETALDIPVPRSWFSNYPSASTLGATLYVQTYTNESCTVTVGSAASAALELRADAGMKPALGNGWATLSPYNTGAVSTVTGYVKGYSKAEASFDSSKIDMSAAVGASIASYSVTCQGQTDSASPYLTPVLNAASVSVTCTVTDTRGRTASETFTLSVMDYSDPVLTGVSVYRCDSLGNADENGSCYAVTTGVSVSPLDGQNAASLRCALTAAGGSYGAETALADGVRSVLGTISPDQSYTVRVTATDALGGAAVFYQAIPTRKWAMKFRSNGRGVAFGKAAEFDDCFELSPDWPLRIRGGDSDAQYLMRSCSGGGSNLYFKIADLSIADEYVDYPISFEIAQRGLGLSTLKLQFASDAGTDPALAWFRSDGSRAYYVRKTAAGAWELIGKYPDAYGAAVLHRIVNDRCEGVTVTPSMTNLGAAAPSGTIQASSALADTIYPVGSIYLSVNPSSPQTLFGGSWEQIKDTFLLAAGTAYTAGDTGGSATHSHNLDSNGYAEIIIHGPSNAISYRERKTPSWTSNYKGSTTGSSESVSRNYGAELGGETAAASSMPPYLAVYMWKRTA